ncbi:MAG: hypothetical protein S4CHLAM81_13440 [Chlamydiales bacterium]|nr:hypothetical protein [Chlamydiales bacterium]MCH9636116.1 hypothetical protein [Chlamydiales bacterium]MCH9704171.1 hypothetical protein [Chlamydiota bacterium]
MTYTFNAASSKCFEILRRDPNYTGYKDVQDSHNAFSQFYTFRVHHTDFISPSTIDEIREELQGSYQISTRSSLEITVLRLNILGLALFTAITNAYQKADSSPNHKPFIIPSVSNQLLLRFHNLANPKKIPHLQPRINEAVAHLLFPGLEVSIEITPAQSNRQNVLVKLQPTPPLPKRLPTPVEPNSQNIYWYIDQFFKRNSNYLDLRCLQQSSLEDNAFFRYCTFTADPETLEPYSSLLQAGKHLLKDRGFELDLTTNPIKIGLLSPLGFELYQQTLSHFNTKTAEINLENPSSDRMVLYIEKSEESLPGTIKKLRKAVSASSLLAKGWQIDCSINLSKPAGVDQGLPKYIVTFTIERAHPPWMSISSFQSFANELFGADTPIFEELPSTNSWFQKHTIPTRPILDTELSTPYPQFDYCKKEAGIELYQFSDDAAHIYNRIKSFFGKEALVVRDSASEIFEIELRIDINQMVFNRIFDILALQLPYIVQKCNENPFGKGYLFSFSRRYPHIRKLAQSTDSQELQRARPRSAPRAQAARKSTHSRGRFHSAPSAY